MCRFLECEHKKAAFEQIDVFFNSAAVLDWHGPRRRICTNGSLGEGGSIYIVPIVARFMQVESFPKYRCI